MDFTRAAQTTASAFRESIVPRLSDYIRIPNKSPLFDAGWEANGHMQRAAELMAGWCREQPIAGLQVEILHEPGRTPVLFCEIPGRGTDTVLLYGHLDKQPEFTGWAEGLSPWEPVLRDGKLYGRGGADDGYAVFSSLTAIRLLQEQRIPHARCVVLIEACEESGSYDLPHYVEVLAARIGTPSLVVCLDAECGNYEQLWCTTSLRGNLVGDLVIEGLTEGVHSGAGTGIAPSVFRIARTLLARVESDVTGDLLVDELTVPIPPARIDQARAAAGVLGAQIAGKLPFVPGARALSDSPVELVLNNTWRPTLAVTGAAGLPLMENAGNVLLPRLELKLSFRLPPSADADAAAAAVKKRLEADPPYGVRVRFDVGSSLPGWDAPPVAPWLEAAMREASRATFGRDAMYLGTGGSIPFIGMLGERFPGTQFLVTGVLGPHSNAHGPNEFLHLDCAEKLTVCVAKVIADHHGRPPAQ
jgi:acetylornithine deacetylase/succinyl-diaminopimelate desuccinylase-like protein